MGSYMIPKIMQVVKKTEGLTPRQLDLSVPWNRLVPKPTTKFIKASLFMIFEDLDPFRLHFD